MILNPKKIIISRTDSIGDVMLTLPMAGIIKENFPDCKIWFVGKTYTQPIIAACKNVDCFINFDLVLSKTKKEQVEIFKKIQADVFIHVFPDAHLASIIKKAGIPMRIGTGHRLFHLLTCNYKVNFSRKKSDLHEAQLNLKLLRPLGIGADKTTEALSEYYGLSAVENLPGDLQSLLSGDKKNIILHPKSKGSAVEWGVRNFSELSELLLNEGFRVFITGTEEEGNQVRHHFQFQNDLIDMSGKLSLNQLISFINAVDGLVAASTGPLHIAAALGKATIGLYSPRRPVHPGRWAPVGLKAKALVYDPGCVNCANGKLCGCVTSIACENVVKELVELVS